MKKELQCVLAVPLLIFMTACGTPSAEGTGQNNSTPPKGKLPAPFETKSSVNVSNYIGWESGTAPTAPKGFKVEKLADGFDNPRWIYEGPNGDLFVSQANWGRTSANRITILRDADKNGTYETRDTFLNKLNQPLGMLIIGDRFYVANTDGLFSYPYKVGETRLTSKPQKLVDLPAGGYNNHWSRNIILSPDGRKIFISVGSGSNVGENGMDLEERRANILEVNTDGTGERIFASGLRNPVGMDFVPGTNILWTAVNERDNLGDDLVPDYMTSVKEGAFYGWPYSYFGQNEDPRQKGKRPDLVKKAIVPDIDLGSHTASLGLAFYRKKNFPEKYRGGAFVAQHGSWNRSKLAGYKVIFVPFKDNKPAGDAEDFLTGFIADESKSTVHGRPVGITMLADGSMLVADDSANTIWKVSAQ